MNCYNIVKYNSCSLLLVFLSYDLRFSLIAFLLLFIILPSFIKKYCQNMLMLVVRGYLFYLPIHFYKIV